MRERKKPSQSWMEKTSMRLRMLIDSLLKGKSN